MLVLVRLQKESFFSLFAKQPQYSIPPYNAGATATPSMAPKEKRSTQAASDLFSTIQPQYFYPFLECRNYSHSIFILNEFFHIRRS